MQMQSTKPHLALFTSPGMGHLIPFLELAKRLVSHHNFKVTAFVMPTDYATISPSKYLQSPDLDLILLPFVDLSHLVGTNAPLTAKIVAMTIESLPFLRSEISKMECRPTALVVDLFGIDALEIADEFHMLKYVFMTNNAWFSAVILHGPEIDRNEVEEHVRNHKPLKIPGCTELKLEDTLDVFHRDADHPLYQRFLDAGVKMSLTDGILVNSWDELEPTTFKALREANKVPIYPIGPLIRPIEPISGNNQVLNWLDKQPEESVIYVSFGSGGTLSAQQVIELAWGLDLSQQRFVWVVRPPTENNASGSYFSSSGKGSDCTPDYLPDGFFTRTQHRGLVVPTWAPQVEVLGHPSIGGFITHCGWNSALESMVNGVPMIAWPLYAEQKMNAAMLTEEIGASIRFRAKADGGGSGGGGREHIKWMVRRILLENEGGEIRDRVKALKNSGDIALREGGSSFNTLAQLADICIQQPKPKAYGYGTKTRLDLDLDIEEANAMDGSGSGGLMSFSKREVRV